MNLEDAVSAHQKWKIRLGMVVDGNSSESLDPSMVEKDNQCELGKWIHGEGQSHRARPEFAEMVTEHAAFHRLAGSVLRKALKGDRPGAKAELDGVYYQQSQKTVMSILKLKKAIK